MRPPTIKKITCAFFLLSGLCWPIMTARLRGQGRIITLDNGLRAAFQEKAGPPLAAVALAVGIGARDGDDAAGGPVHLLEHLLLFGSSRQRPAAEKTAAIRRLGAQINAHTDHDLMTFEILLPVGELESGLRILKETVFESCFSEDEMRQEKRIIRAETNQIHDDPGRLGPTVALQELFSGHPYSRPLSGAPDAVDAVGPDALRALLRGHFIAGNCALAVAGPVDSRQAEAQVRAVFADLPAGDPPRRTLPALPPLRQQGELKRRLDVQQSHLFFAFRAPAYNHPDRRVLDVLNHILGRGINPMLAGIFRHGQCVVSGLESNYFVLARGGALVMHFTTAPANVHFLKNQLEKRLGQLAAFRFSRADFPGVQQFAAGDFLESARNQLRWSGEEFKESGLDMAVAIARYLLLHEEAEAGSPAAKEIDAISANDLRRCAGLYLSGEKFVWLTISAGEAGQ